MAHKRVLIVANKNWEATALMNVLLEPKACPDKFPWPVKLAHPVPPGTDWNNPQPRAVFHFDDSPQGRNSEVRVEVWCIQDAMDPSVSSSSTKEKMRVLPKFFIRHGDKEVTADLVVAFGTAGFPGEISHNGSVVVGASTFIHNPFEKDSGSDSHWHSNATGCLILPSLRAADLFNTHINIFNEAFKGQIESRFVVPPMNPASEQGMLAGSPYAAVGVVNITNYDDYVWADEAAHRRFEATHEASQGTVRIGSLETTHGIVRLQSEAPFIFVSGITDRIGHFNEDVGLRSYAQNFACAHNAGVATAWLIPQVVKFLSLEGA